MFISYVDYFLVKILLRKGASKKIILITIASIGLLILGILYNHFYTAFNTTFYRILVFIIFSGLLASRLQFINTYINRYNKKNKVK